MKRFIYFFITFSIAANATRDSNPKNTTDQTVKKTETQQTETPQEAPNLLQQFWRANPGLRPNFNQGRPVITETQPEICPTNMQTEELETNTKEQTNKSTISDQIEKYQNFVLKELECLQHKYREINEILNYKELDEKEREKLQNELEQIEEMIMVLIGTQEQNTTKKIDSDKEEPKINTETKEPKLTEEQLKNLRCAQKNNGLSKMQRDNLERLMLLPYNQLTKKQFQDLQRFGLLPTTDTQEQKEEKSEKFRSLTRGQLNNRRHDVDFLQQYWQAHSEKQPNNGQLIELQREQNFEQLVTLSNPGQNSKLLLKSPIHKRTFFGNSPIYVKR